MKRAELTMRTGICVPVNSNEDAEELVRYIERCTKGYDEFKIKETVCKYNENIAKYLCFGMVGDMQCVTLLLSSSYPEYKEEYYPEPFAEDYGTECPSAFCYVYNLDVEWCSEFGVCFFEMTPYGYRRIN